MILDWLMDAAQKTVEWMVSLFPDADPTFDPTAHLTEILGKLGDLNYFLPIAETVSVVVAVFALFPVFLGITLSLWVAAQLRGSSSVG